jgi:DHA1 family bicyclomycin/chloramphenicol resistance-like MFS transporter
MSSKTKTARSGGISVEHAGGGTAVVAILGALVALGPLSTDAYVPGLPDLARDLGTSASSAQLTITTCLIGLAAGQILAGPLSDARGRRGPLLFGLALYTVAGLLCALAPSVWALIVLRAVQGIGGAFAIVIAFASVRDRFSGVAAARYFSLLLLVTGLAPVLSPLFGAQVLRFGDWRAVFVALAVISALILLAVAVRLPESLPVEKRHQGGAREMRAVFGALLRDRRYVGFALANAFAFGAMFAYIAGSPFVLQDIYGLSVQQYAVVFAVNALGLVIAAQVSGRLVAALGPRRLLAAGVLGSALGGVGLFAAIQADAAVALVLVGFFVVVASVGLVMPNAAALALEDHGANAGSASALLGFSQFFLGGVVAPIVGIAGAHDAGPTAAVIAVLGLAALLAFTGLTGARRS